MEFVDGILRVALPPGVPGYITQLGNTAKFSDPPVTSILDFGPKQRLRAFVTGSFARRTRPATLFLLAYGSGGAMERISISLQAGSAAAQSILPAEGGCLALCIRCVDDVEIGFLSLNLVVEDVPTQPVAPPLPPPLPAAPSPSPRPAVTRPVLPSPLVPAAVPEAPRISHWTAIARHVRLTREPRLVLGVCRPLGIKGVVQQSLRVDEDLPVDFQDLAAGFVFDDEHASATFGWDGVFTPAGGRATLALIRHLRKLRNVQLPAILLRGPRTHLKALVADAEPLFTHRFGAEAPDLAARLAGTLGLRVGDRP